MTDENSLTQLIQRLRQGDCVAAGEIWARCAPHLKSLADRDLWQVTKRVADGDDLVQDVLLLFFEGIAAGKFPDIDSSESLWRLLHSITHRRAINQNKYWTAKVRGGGAVRGDSVFAELFADSQAGLQNVADRKARAQEFISIQIDEFLDLLPSPVFRQIASRRMHGEKIAEIATALKISRAAVSRKLTVIRSIWNEAHYD